MNYKRITYEKNDQIGRIILHRSDGDNPNAQATADELASCCQLINQDNEVRIVILSGNDKAFSSSGDSASLQASGISSSAIASLKCPVIACIDGDAVGNGLELTLACDLRFAVDTAKFGFPEVSSGIIPSGGGTQRLPRIVGRGKALELILTAAFIDADEAWRIGLVNKVLTEGELTETVEALAQKIASKGPVSERCAKEAISKGMDMTLGQGLRLEADLSFLLQSTSDRTEGINAFQGKRTPDFKGD